MPLSPPDKFQLISEDPVRLLPHLWNLLHLPKARWVTPSYKHLQCFVLHDSTGCSVIYFPYKSMSPCRPGKSTRVRTMFFSSCEQGGNSIYVYEWSRNVRAGSLVLVPWYSVAPGERRIKEWHLPKLGGHFRIVPSQVPCANTSHLLVVNIYDWQNVFPNSYRIVILVEPIVQHSWNKMCWENLFLQIPCKVAQRSLKCSLKCKQFYLTDQSGFHVIISWHFIRTTVPSKRHSYVYGELVRSVQADFWPALPWVQGCLTYHSVLSSFLEDKQCVHPAGHPRAHLIRQRLKRSQTPQDQDVLSWGKGWGLWENPNRTVFTYTFLICIFKKNKLRISKSTSDVVWWLQHNK